MQWIRLDHKEAKVDHGLVRSPSRPSCQTTFTAFVACEWVQDLGVHYGRLKPDSENLEQTRHEEVAESVEVTTTSHCGLTVALLRGGGIVMEATFDLNRDSHHLF